MKFVKLLLGTGLLGAIGYLLWKQWSAEAAGAGEWLATGPSTPANTAPEPHTRTSVQSVPETEDELAISDAEEEGLPATDPFEGQDPLTAPLPEDL